MNRFITEIKDMSLNNKYSTWYVGIVSNALLRARTRSEAKKVLNYVEAHHILPKCFCHDESKKKNSENVCFLSAREHFICHLLLSRMFNVGSIEKYKMTCALLRCTYSKNNTDRERYVPMSRWYEINKIKISEEKKGKVPIKAMLAAQKANTGKKFTEERLEKHRIGARNRKPRMPFSNEGRANMSAAKQHRKWWSNGISEVWQETKPNDEWWNGRLPGYSPHKNKTNHNILP